MTEHKPRIFEYVLTKMLSHIPDDDLLKSKLNKILDKYPYKAPEIKKFAWNDVQDCLVERFENVNEADMSEWAITISKIWSNKETL
jgi:hypothetical protein